MENYDIHFDICALIIYLFTTYIFFRKKDVRSFQNTLFLSILLCSIVSGTADIAASVMMRIPDKYPLPLIFLSNYIYLLCHNTVPGLYAAYILIMTGIDRRFTKGFFLFFFSPVLLNVIIIATNPLTHWIFTYIPPNYYAHGILFPVLYFSFVFYVSLGLYFIIRYKRVIPSHQFGALLAFLVCGVGAVVFQIFFPQLLVELFLQSFICLFILIVVENEDNLLNMSTDVYNRHCFFQKNAKLLNSGKAYAIVIIKCTNVRYFTSVLGVQFMEELLRNICKWLVSLMGNRSRVFDCENGVFALLFEMGQQTEVEGVANTVYQRFMEDWIHRDVSVALRTQLALVWVPFNVSNLESIITLIDFSDGKQDARVSIMQDEQLLYLKREADVQNAIEYALEHKTFKVYYQPIWDSKANKIHSAEALVRLIDPKMGFISPEEFIPIAEKTGTITEIGQMVFEEACRLMSSERVRTIGLDFIEVNLSTVQCMHKDLPAAFQQILEKYSLSSSSINLEITESAAINSAETFHQIMQDLRNIGFSFSLDDYGTDHAEATYIFNMDFEIIKIDKSILWRAADNATAKIFLQNTVRMIKEMGLKIVVEGVESEAQKRLVTSLGCDYCQGYFFSKPLPENDFLEYTRLFNGKLPI